MNMAVFPIYNILVVPDAYIYFKAEYYRQFAGKPPVQDEKVILIVAKEDLPRSELTNDSFYPIGLSGVITEVSDNGHAMAAYMMSVGLWVACLAFCLMYPLTKHDGLESGFKWWLSKASVLYPMAVVQAVVLVLVLHFALGFEPARLGQTILVACLTSVAFMSIMYFFNVLLGKIGSFLMLIFMVLQLAGSAGTYPLEVSGPLAAALNKYMPFTYTVAAFRSSIGGGEPFPSAVKILLAIFICSSVLTVILFVIRGKKELAGKTNLYDVMEAHGFA